MIRAIQAGLVALFIISALPPSHAQYTDEGPSKFGIKLMNFVPMDGNLKDVKSVWTGIGLDYYLKMDEEGRPTAVASFGVMSANNGGLDVSNYPITYTRLRRYPISATRSKYNGYGVGVYRLKLELAGIASDSSYQPGMHAIYGQEFGDSFFAEIRADLLPKWRDSRWGGVFLNIGTRLSL